MARRKTPQTNTPALEPIDGPDLYVVGRYRTGDALPYGVWGTAGGKIRGGLDLARAMLDEGLARLRSWIADPREGQDIPDRLALLAVDLPGLPTQPDTPPTNPDFSEPPEWTAWNAAMKEILGHPERWVIRESIAEATVARHPSADTGGPMLAERKPTEAETRLLRWLRNHGEPVQISVLYGVGHRRPVIERCEIEGWIDRPVGAMHLRQITDDGRAALLRSMPVAT